MPITNYAIAGRYPYGNLSYTRLRVSHVWERSPRVNGKLRLRANRWTLNVIAESSTNWIGPTTPASEAIRITPLASLPSKPPVVRAIAVAQSDLRGTIARKIKAKNVGALGVSIATAGRSIEMLRNSGDRFVQGLNGVQKLYATSRFGRKKLKRLRRLLNKGAPVTAGMVLEGFFGWAPLLTDMISAAKTVSDPWPPGWVSASRSFAVGPFREVVKVDPLKVRTIQWDATGRESYSCRVTVANPNIWLANKLGLLNLPGIAWDLVPWSFLVNMVSNMGQCMGSLTDFAGLHLTDTSATHGLWANERCQSSYMWTNGRAASASGTLIHKYRSRDVPANPPPVTPYFRFPEWNIGAAAIVGALLVKQIHLFDAFLRSSRS